MKVRRTTALCPFGGLVLQSKWRLKREVEVVLWSYRTTSEPCTGCDLWLTRVWVSGPSFDKSKNNVPDTFWCTVLHFLLPARPWRASVAHVTLLFNRLFYVVYHSDTAGSPPRHHIHEQLVLKDVSSWMTAHWGRGGLWVVHKHTTSPEGAHCCPDVPTSYPTK